METLEILTGIVFVVAVAGYCWILCKISKMEEPPK